MCSEYQWIGNAGNEPSRVKSSRRLIFAAWQAFTGHDRSLRHSGNLRNVSRRSSIRYGKLFDPIDMFPLSRFGTAMRYLCQLASSVPPDSSDVTMKTTNMKTTNMCVCVCVCVCGSLVRPWSFGQYDYYANWTWTSTSMKILTTKKPGNGWKRTNMAETCKWLQMQSCWLAWVMSPWEFS